MLRMRTLVLGLLVLWATSFGISPGNLKFVEYPGFDEKHSTWGSIGYSAKYDKVIIGVCNHINKVAIYEYDCAKGTMSLRNWVAKGGHLQPFQWQAKIHTPIVENKKDGWMYFGTDAGESKAEYYMDHPDGYVGGFFMRYNPKTFELEALGQGLKQQSLKELQIDQIRQRLYGIAYPSAHFLIKDLKSDSLYDKGGLNKGHVSRVLFTDDWGNAYYNDIRGHLVKYQADADSFIFALDSLPHYPTTEGWIIRTGMRAWARDKDTYFIMTHWGRLLSFITQEKGLGPVGNIGDLWEDPSRSVDSVISAGAPNLACGANHKLYYWVGGHGHYLLPDTAVFIECDPKTKNKTILYKFPIKTVMECTGSQIVDKRGNIYFAARRNAGTRSYGESGTSEPFLIIFNPQKELK